MSNIFIGIKHKNTTSTKEKAIKQKKDNEDISTIYGETSTIQGIGMINSSDNVVYGEETKFLEQIKSGDVITVLNPTTCEDESVVVRYVSSNTSLMIEKPFTKDIISLVHYDITKVKLSSEQQARKVMEQQDDEEVENSKRFGEYVAVGGNVYTVTTKSGSAFRDNQTKLIKASRPLTRSEQLDLRVKNKSDRHCM